MRFCAIRDLGRRLKERLRSVFYLDMVGVVGSSPIAPTNPMPARFLSVLLILFSAAAAAQYPSRPIHLIVPIPPGGAPDIAARVLGQKLSEQMGQPVVVENRVAPTATIAPELVARATPDGYTLGLVADSQIAINPHLYSKMSFDTLRDLTPVSSVASNQFVLAINPSLPVNS